MTGKDDLAAREFTALRSTIQGRGSTRPFAFLLGIVAWAGALLTVLSWLPIPAASLVPLAVLLGTFEVLRSLHLGVERIGRYLQVFYEEGAGGSAPTAPPAWEHTAMRFGSAIPGAGVHPYFQPVFLLAIAVNFLAVIFPGPVPVELATLSVPHVALVAWVLYCDRGMRRQRDAELKRLRELYEERRAKN